MKILICALLLASATFAKEDQNTTEEPKLYKKRVVVRPTSSISNQLAILPTGNSIGLLPYDNVSPPWAVEPQQSPYYAYAPVYRAPVNIHPSFRSAYVENSFAHPVYARPTQVFSPQHYPVPVNGLIHVPVPYAPNAPLPYPVNVPGHAERQLYYAVQRPVGETVNVAASYNIDPNRYYVDPRSYHSFVFQKNQAQESSQAAGKNSVEQEQTGTVVREQVGTPQQYVVRDNGLTGTPVWYKSQGY